ncbi:MAE_28990/MAE_18760 family HEPN-like nuclease [Corynebacterium phoceense]|uniref:MAE_28990/MAE_18760 family HEPN-like nuclease n=1 Tax=Corynebacterium phoceense TaxID=1686286 RepID=UPI00211C2295|nr:MAE_28990/MAE_18760 family HEPN-like nuclease [Corynebacterium phoceense]MCQ9345224.1 MAE_28990/MAE_18760 family HEPN-like nuclease [Corynebacterium phoceense]
MKIRTLDELQAKLDESSSWRRAEITYFHSQLQSSKAIAQKHYLRAATALLYAHWEGLIKEQAQFYLAYLNAKKIPNRELTPGLLASSLRSRLVLLELSGDAKGQKGFATFLLEGGLEENALFKEEIIDTGANLSWAKFEQILVRLGISDVPYQVHRKMIDRVVGWRNHIAHGQHWVKVDETELTVSTFFEAEEVIVNIMKEFKRDIRLAASNYSSSA